MTRVNSKIPAWVSGRTSPRTVKGREATPIVTEAPIAATEAVTTEAVWMKIEEFSDDNNFDPFLRKDLHTIACEDLFTSFKIFTKTDSMSADKKIDAADLPRPEKKEDRHKSQEEFDLKANDNPDLRRRDSMKKRKIDYVVRDLPIY